MKARDIWSLAKESVKEWSDDKASRLAAALAYYAVFSIPALLFIAIAVALDRVFGEAAARQELLAQVGGFVGPQGAEIVGTMLDNVNAPGSGLIGTIVGSVALLLSASTVFAQLRGALNTIWEVEEAPSAGVLATVLKRVGSFVMVVAVGLLLIGALLASSLLGALSGTFQQFIPIGAPVIRVVGLLFTFAVTVVLFAVIFKAVPDAKVAWRDVWVGAVVTGLMFTVGNLLIGLYLANSATASVYGAAGSLIILLLWLYYSAQVFLLGAEFTQVYANRYGSLVKEDKDSVPMAEKPERSLEYPEEPGRRDGQERRGERRQRGGGEDRDRRRAA